MEGGLKAPVRHPIDWTDPDFLDPAKLDAELRRVFDVCHGCRRCFNLCDSFPRLFDLIDGSETGELDSVASAGFKPVIDACTLCDLCFMVSCPYVPPHDFNIDFPHLMLRYRAGELAAGKTGVIDRQLARTDRNGRLARPLAALANWASDLANRPVRAGLEKLAAIHRDAALPKYHARTFVMRAKAEPPQVNRAAPGHGRKAVLYATCFVNYNNPAIGVAAQAVLAHNGVETAVVYPGCCGMPQLEHADFANVAERAKRTAQAMAPWLDQGYEIIALVPSCALMLKFEWPLILPEDESIKRLSQHTADIAEYVVAIAATDGLAGGLRPLDGGIAVHLACHARAQNMGAKAVELLKLIPGADLGVIERCSGHGGAWGVKRDNFEVALRVGKPAARQAQASGKAHLVSECPLAGGHLVQGVERLGAEPPRFRESRHPIELFARAYGLIADTDEVRS
jgi:glycerol-3-phosphate dehydrogenase subunit C